MPRVKSEADKAPHGLNEDGTPMAPFGYNVDGTPRKSNRGAKAGQKGNTTSRPTTSRTDARRKETLVGLADMLVITPLAGLSASPQLERRFGPAQTDALAGDAVIIGHFMPSLADSLIVLSQSKPGALAWLDSVEEKAPYLMLAQVGMQLTKALVENHLSPNPNLAAAGRTMVRARMEMLAAQINAEAEAMGIPTEAPRDYGQDQADAA